MADKTPDQIFDEVVTENYGDPAEINVTDMTTTEEELRSLVTAALVADRKQSDVTTAVAEALDDRGAHEAADLVRRTDDDTWNSYFGPMLDDIERDYTAVTREMDDD